MRPFFAIVPLSKGKRVRHRMRGNRKEWSDEQAFNSFIQSAEFRAVTTWGKEQILSGRPQHKIYKH